MRKLQPWELRRLQAGKTISYQRMTQAEFLRRYPEKSDTESQAAAWNEYERAAEDLARKGLKGEIGDPLPLNMSADAVALINEDTEAFTVRVRQNAYAIAMSRINLEVA